MKDFIYGIHPVMEFLNSGRQPESVLIQRDLNNPAVAQLKTVLRDQGHVYKAVPVEKLNRVTRKNHQGVICFVSPITYFRTEDMVPLLFESGKTPLVLVLDHITDVRNFGSICRSAACAGVHLVIVPDRGAAQVNADAVKASSGALEQLPVAREADLRQTVRYLKDSGLRVIACTEKAQAVFTDSDMTGPLALVLGSEEKGILPEILKHADEWVRIPMQGKIASLNVSVAAGIMLFESVRQRSA